MSLKPLNSQASQPSEKLLAHVACISVYGTRPLHITHTTGAVRGFLVSLMYLYHYKRCAAAQQFLIGTLALCDLNGLMLPSLLFFLPGVSPNLLTSQGQTSRSLRKPWIRRSPT